MSKKVHLISPLMKKELSAVLDMETYLVDGEIVFVDKTVALDAGYTLYPIIDEYRFSNLKILDDDTTSVVVLD